MPDAPSRTTSSVSSSPASAATPAWLDAAAYPFTPRWCELRDGSRLHYVDEGNGDTLLFSHGTPTWSFEWRHLIRALAPTHRCVAPDHLGFGLSDRPLDAEYTPEAHAERFAAFVERLDLRDVTLVVHDFGGPIALPLALADRSRVRRLVVLNSWMWSLAGDSSVERPARLLGGALGKMLYRHANLSLKTLMPSAYADRAKLTPAIHAQYLAPFDDAWSRGAVLWPLARALRASSAHYARLWEARARLRDVPALVVWGMRDAAFRPHHLARWREALPQATVVELPAGHWPHEELPDEVIAVMRSFLRAGS